MPINYIITSIDSQELTFQLAKKPGGQSWSSTVCGAVPAPPTMNAQTGDSLPEKLILAFSPGYCCWHCERPLPPAFTAVYAAPVKEAAGRPPCLFLTCGQTCQQHVVKVCGFHDLVVEAWSGSRLRELLDYPDKIAGIVVGKATAPSLVRAIARIVENAANN